LKRAIDSAWVTVWVAIRYVQFSRRIVMAYTTKLASTFKAWRLTIGVPPEHIGGAIMRCMELGLQPKPCAFQDGRVLFSVTVPCNVCKDAVRDFTEGPLKSFHAAVFHGIEVKLICPIPEWNYQKTE